MDDIASHLGISKRSIYERFKDKDSLLLAVLESLIVWQREMMESILKDSPDVIAAIFTIIRIGREHVASLNPLIRADLKKYHNKVMIQLGERCGHPEHEISLKILEKGISQGIFWESIDCEIISRAFTGIATLGRDEELFPPGKFLPREIIRNIMLNFLRGISTARGVDLIDSHEKDL